MNNGWFVIYALGCICAVVVMTVNVAVAWVIGWVTHANTVNRNLKKLQPPDTTPWVVRAGTFIGIAVFAVLETALLSWISVALGVWRFIRVILELFRNLFASVPEAVRTLRFPLRTNPHLSRESVWAYVCALGTLVGQPVTQPNDLLLGFDEVVEHYPNFDSRLALRQLQSLRVIDPSVIADALALLNRQANIRSFGEDLDAWL